MCVLRRPSCVHGYTALFVVALCAPARPQQPVPQQRSIKQVFEEDQRDRQHLDYSKLSKEDWQKIQARDAARREETKQLVASGAAKTGDDYRDAAFIFQHGDKSEDFLLAHVLAVAAIAKGDVTATWVSAATLDRYLQSLKQPQVFGTQYVLKDPNAVLNNPKAPRKVTQDPYDKNVLSDALRNVYCVLPYAVQQQNVEAMNKGQNPQPDSCH
jgi:hypothetical protein